VKSGNAPYNLCGGGKWFAVLGGGFVLEREDERLSCSEADAELVQRACGGDTEAFAALCERYRMRVWRVVASVARGAEADDLAQETVVRAFCALKTYRAEAPFEAWLCRIALNLAHDYQRSAWRRRVTLCEPKDFWETENGSETTQSEVERRELQRRVRQAVATLPDTQRTPIWLHYFEGFPLVQVARLEETSEGTVRSRVRAGLRRLSLSLEDLLPVAETPRPLEPRPKGCRA